MSIQVCTRECALTLTPTHTQQQQHQEERGVLTNFPSSGPGTLKVRLALRDVIRNGTETDGCASKPCPHQGETWASIFVSDGGRKVKMWHYTHRVKCFVKTNRRRHGHEINLGGKAK